MRSEQKGLIFLFLERRQGIFWTIFELVKVVQVSRGQRSGGRVEMALIGIRRVRVPAFSGFVTDKLETACQATVGNLTDQFY